MRHGTPGSTPVPAPAGSGETAQDFDLVVVGSGAAGLTSAVVARLRGLRVVLVEKADVLGGITAISGGGLWVPCSPTAQRLGIPDSLDDARRYIAHRAGSFFDPARTDAFLRAGPEMVDFLERQAGITFTVAADRPDYYPNEDGATLGGRTLFPTDFDGRALGESIRLVKPPLREMTFLGMMLRPASDLRHFMNAGRSLQSLSFVVKRMLGHGFDVLRHGRSTKLAGGNALIAHLLRAANNAGVEIRTGTAARALIMDGERVAGVECRTAKGPLRLRASRGVVLAAGGFPHDLDLRAQHFPHPSGAAQHLSPAPETNTGDGIRMGLTVGGHTPRLADAACWAPVSSVPLERGRSGRFPHLIDRQKPGFLAVTRDGRRFVNESHSYHEYGRGLIAATRDGADAVSFLIADHAAVRRYGMGFAKPAPMLLQPYVRSGYLVRARTIRELAQRVGIDPDGLERTVSAFNEAARRGEDPEFGRGTSAYNRYLGNASHTPNPCVAPLERGPFYAVEVRVGELGTFSGLAVDEHARVLTRGGAPVEGLYAAGTDMSHVMGGQYVGGGSLIGPGMTFGFVAASHAAKAEAVRHG